MTDRQTVTQRMFYENGFEEIVFCTIELHGFFGAINLRFPVWYYILNSIDIPYGRTGHSSQ